MADLDFINPYVVEPFRRSRVRRTLSTPLESGGLGITRQKWQGALLRFDVSVDFPTSVLLAQLDAFFETEDGARRQFTWTAIDDGLVYTCRFAADELSTETSGPESHDASFTLLAVLAPT